MRFLWKIMVWWCCGPAPSNDCPWILIVQGFLLWPSPRRILFTLSHCPAFFLPSCFCWYHHPRYSPLSAQSSMQGSWSHHHIYSNISISISIILIISILHIVRLYINCSFIGEFSSSIRCNLIFILCLCMCELSRKKEFSKVSFLRHHITFLPENGGLKNQFATD